MGFLHARNKAVACLRKNHYFAEDREGSPVKNLLAIGMVTALDVERMLLGCRGDRKSYQEDDHHDSRKPMIHIFKPKPWYIKLYFMDPDCVFISVHKQNENH